MYVLANIVNYSCIVFNSPEVVQTAVETGTEDTEEKNNHFTQ